MRSASVSVAVLSFTLFGSHPGMLTAQGPVAQSTRHQRPPGSESSGGSGAVDPGPRPGAANAGGALPGLNGGEQNVFNESLSVFMEVGSVSGTVPGEEGVGLGPTFNGNSCAQCHAQPALGGGRPGLSSPRIPWPILKLRSRTRMGQPTRFAVYNR